MRAAARRRSLLLGALLLAIAPTSALAVSGNDPLVLVAGTPNVAGNTGDNGPATSATLTRPRGVAADFFGNVYIAQRTGSVIRRVNANGTISLIAGAYATATFAGDGGPATAAFLNGPSGVAADKSGNIYIADEINGRIRKIDRLGIITSIASGLAGPLGVAVDNAGNVYASNPGGHRVLKISAAGIGVVAGTGAPGYNGDGQLAAASQLNGPVGVAVDAFGRVYIADSGNARIRRVDLDGIIRTVAGNGMSASAGDGGPAVQAQVQPTGVAVDGATNVYISEGAPSHRIRKVNRAGIITTIAGNGSPGAGGNGGPAHQATLNTPFNISVEPSGSLLIGDEGSSTVRRIVNIPPVAAFNLGPDHGNAPLAVGFDGSPSTGVNDGIADYFWNFGDGAGAMGQRPSHTYTGAGTFTVTLTVVDDSGGLAVTTRQIAVGAPGGPPPARPDLNLTGAGFRGTWSASRVKGNLTVTGNVPRAAKLQIQVVGPGRASKVRQARNFSTTKSGSFRQVVKLAPALLPGSYRVRVRDLTRGQKLTTRERKATLAAPREGVASRAFVSTGIFGAPRATIRRGPGVIVANYVFAALPAKGRSLTVTWRWSGRKAAIKQSRHPRQRTLAVFLRNRTGGLPAGVYRAELRAGGKLVAVAQTRIR